MTALFLATCGLACGFYLSVLIRVRGEKKRVGSISPEPKSKVVEFRRPPVSKKERAKSA
ncbi:MAG TPA: hypothetical protein VJR23_19815 [Candidatus Acidoferrales bacterium]|nr:hypothetical protein [Candidatus Acidoferrales bacterium]